MRLSLLIALLAVAGQAQDLLTQAEEHLRAERFAQAETLLTQAVQKDPASVEALYRLGYAQYRQRKLAAARRNFAAVVKAAPPAHYSRYFLGRIALLENKPLEAVTWLEPAAGVFDGNSQLAMAYAAAGQTAKAVGPLKAAIAAAPWDGALYYRLGQLHQKLGQSELAREALENSTRLNNASRADVETIMRTSQAMAENKGPQGLELAKGIMNRADADPNALVALGVVLGSAGLLPEALQSFERAAARDATLYQAQFNYGLALMKAGRAADALGPLARAVDLLPQAPEANTSLGLAAVISQRYAEAVAPLERAWRIDASNPRVGSLLATAYLRTNAARKAVPVLRDLAARGGDDPSAPLLLVEALNAIEDQAGALEAAQSARKRFPKLPQAHMAAAQQLARLGRYQDARPAFEEVLRLAPAHPEAELGLADTLQKAGEHGPAAEHYQAALNGPTAALSARLGLARSLVALRKLTDARAVLEQGLTDHPSDVTLRLDLSRVYARLGESAMASEQARIAEDLRTRQAKP